MKRAGPERAIIREAMSTAAMLAREATINMTGRLVTGKLERKSASRVARPATWAAIRKAPQKAAAVAARPAACSLFGSGPGNIGGERPPGYDSRSGRARTV